MVSFNSPTITFCCFCFPGAGKVFATEALRLVGARREEEFQGSSSLSKEEEEEEEDDESLSLLKLSLLVPVVGDVAIRERLAFRCSC